MTLLKQLPKRYSDPATIRGFEVESAVINWLSTTNEVKPETTKENVKDDIDCYINGVSVSIKNQERAAKTGNLCFELYVFNRFYRRHGRNFDVVGRWEPSTWYKPKDVYLVVVSNTVYWIDCGVLTDFVMSNGWFKKTELHPATIKRQWSQGHAHTNAKLGLLRVEALVEANVAEILSTNFDYKQWTF